MARHEHSRRRAAKTLARRAAAWLRGNMRSSISHARKRRAKLRRRGSEKHQGDVAARGETSAKKRGSISTASSASMA